MNFLEKHANEEEKDNCKQRYFIYEVVLCGLKYSLNSGTAPSSHSVSLASRSHLYTARKHGV